MNIKTANRLCELRKKHNLSQEDLAGKLGVSRQAISKWERSESSPDTDNLIELAKLYGVTLDELLNGEEAIELIEESKNESLNGEESDDDTIFIKDDENNTVRINKKKIIINENGEEHVISKEIVADKIKEHIHIEEVIGGISTLLIVIAYITLGCLLPNAEGWANYWFLFILMPVVPSIPEAIRKRRVAKFNYALTVTAVYCALGMFMGLWHPLWILFLTIPVFYTFAKIIDKATGHYKGDDEDDEDDEETSNKANI